MGTLRETLLRLAGFVTRRAGRRDDELRAELQFHADMLEADLRARGIPPPDAARQARLQLGGATQIAESYGDQRTIPRFESVVQDVRYTVRSFRRAPAFSLAALLALALGIGATTAIFTVVNAVLLRPLPFPRAAELVFFGDSGPGDSTHQIGYATFADLRDRTQSFQALAAIRSWQPTLVTSEAERLEGLRVSWNYLSLLGAQPAIGRAFREEEDHPDRSRVVVLSDGLWRRRFNADPGVVGRTIRMNDLSYEVLGVMPRKFDDVVSGHAYDRAQLWAPLGYDDSLSYACRTCRHLKAVGRLAPGVTVEQAAADLTGIRAGLARQFPTEYNATDRVGLTRLEHVVAGQVREPLYLLLAAVGFVLLVACANVANLLLARAMSRTREMAVRSALGAGRARLVRQMLTESVILWTLGGAGGLVLGALLLDSLVSLAPAGLPRAHAIGIDGSVLVFCALVSLATGLLFGLLPALGATSRQAGSALRSGNRGAGGASSRRIRQALVIVDLAVALVLLAGAGLMLKSVSKLLHVDPGFSARGVMTAQFSLVGQAYREDAAVYGFIQRLEERVQGFPGVEAAALAGQIPMGGSGDRYGILIEGLAPANPADAPSAERYSVTPGYFRTMGIPLVRGRLLRPTDTPASEPVMLVSETAARTLFAGTDPIGRRVRFGAPDAPWRTIVGIVGDVRHASLTETTRPQMYLPQSQVTDSFLVIVAKASPDRVSQLVPAIRAALREQDPAVPLHSAAMLDDLLAGSTADRRFVMLLLAGFAAVSLLLAAVGLYGVVSYTISERTRELGLRIALGASRADILKLVLGSGATTAAAGAAIGLAASALFTRFLEGQLFEVEPLDPATIAGAVGLLAVVAALAHLLPVRRALRVDPTTALRQE
ncbi:MAG: ABC transporter permease [Vicinamibacterales bacterium]